MDPSELQDLLRLHGLPTKMRGSDEVLLQVCPSCGNDRWNLEMNPRIGLYNCWACPDSGTVNRLVRRLTGEDPGIQVQLGAEGTGTLGTPTRSSLPAPKGSAAYEVPSAARWLTRRGIPEHVAKEHDLRVCTDRDHPLYSRIIYPQQEFFSGVVTGWGGRSYTNRRPKYLTTGDRRMIGGLRRRRGTPVLLVEGFFDGIAAHGAGFQAAILFGVGFHALETFAARLDPDLPLGILLDGEAREQGNRWYHTLRPIHQKTSVLFLPEGEDPASVGATELGDWLDGNFPPLDES